jgi:hypothetical protein
MLYSSSQTHPSRYHAVMNDDGGGGVERSGVDFDGTSVHALHGDELMVCMADPINCTRLARMGMVMTFMRLGCL